MPYYIRVFGTQLAAPNLDQLRAEALPAVIESLAPETSPWGELLLKHASGEEIAVIERSVTEDGLGADELVEFIEEVAEYEPAKAADWLRHFLPSVKVIYAFQVLSGTEVQDGWARLHAVYSHIWNRAGGILQADDEGFSNEEGYTVLWQFDPKVSGSWNAAVLDGEGQWIKFEMDLGDEAQRRAFKLGEVPPGAKLESDS